MPCRVPLICPYLIGVNPGDLASGPLGQYQATLFDKEDTWRLLRDLNARLSPPHHEALLSSSFQANWPDLHAKLSEMQARLGLDAAARRDELDLPSATKTVITDDADAICLLTSWLGGRTQADNHKAIAFDDVDRELNLTPGTAARLLERAAQKYDYLVDQKGPRLSYLQSSTRAIRPLPSRIPVGQIRATLTDATRVRTVRPSTDAGSTAARTLV